jgi:hypothetical protein
MLRFKAFTPFNFQLQLDLLGHDIVVRHTWLLGLTKNRMEAPGSTATQVITNHLTQCHTTLDYNLDLSLFFAKRVLKMSIRFCLLRFTVSLFIQGDSGSKVNIVGRILSVIVRKTFIWSCVYFWMVVEMELFECPDLTFVDFICVVGWRAMFTKERCIHETNCYLIFFYAAARIKKCEDQLRRTTRNLLMRITKCTLIDGVVFERLLWTVTRSVISV